MSMRLVDLTGNRFGNLMVTNRALNDCRGRAMWICTCDCGKQKTVSSWHLRSGKTRSCGHLVVEFNKAERTTHGLSSTRFYGVWLSMRNRCRNPKVEKYPLYGGRGIQCKWSSFAEFKEDMYQSYLDSCNRLGQHNTTLDRIDFNGDYCKENCRWATWKEQANNNRRNLKNRT